MPILDLVVAFLIIYVVVYFTTEYAQRFFYDQVVNGLAWRAAIIAAPTAVLLVYFPCRLEDMFTTSLHWTILQAAVWVVLTWLVAQYQIPHAAFVGLVNFFVFSTMVTMAIDTLTSRVPGAGT